MAWQHQSTPPEAGSLTSLSEIFDVVDAVQFLSPLTTRDHSTRERAFDRIADVIDQHVDGFGSPVATGNGILLARPSGMMQGKSFLQAVLPGVLRLSIACPFQDVRERAEALLEDIEVKSLY